MLVATRINDIIALARQEAMEAIPPPGTAPSQPSQRPSPSPGNNEGEKLNSGVSSGLSRP
jgi:hypothetical protein